jgi:hypothetical protein
MRRKGMMNPRINKKTIAFLEVNEQFTKSNFI